MKTMTILGSTGSIGTQALEVAAKHNIKVKALAANSDVEKLAAQAKERTKRQSLKSFSVALA